MTNIETIRLPEPLCIDQGHQKLAVQIPFTFATNWGLDDQATKGLINVDDAHYNLWKIFAELKTSDFLPADDIHLIRTSYLIKIISHLRKEFDTQNVATEWLWMQNQSFGFLSPVDLLTSSNLWDMHTICEHLTRRSTLSKIGKLVKRTIK